MHNAAWVKLFQQVPANEQGNLMLVTTVGIEIAIQCVLRIDREFVAIKGRVAGSQDAGRVFFVPFDRIDYFGFQKPVKESEFQEMFGTLEMPDPSEAMPLPAVSTPVATSVLEAAPEPAPTDEVNRPANSTPPPASPLRAPLALKSSVLEKYRSRSTAPGTAIRPPLDE